MRKTLAVLGTAVLAGLTACAHQEAGSPVTAGGPVTITSSRAATATRESTSPARETSSDEESPSGHGKITPELKAQIEKLAADPCANTPKDGAQCANWMRQAVDAARQAADQAGSKDGGGSIEKDKNDLVEKAQQYLDKHCGTGNDDPSGDCHPPLVLGGLSFQFIKNAINY